jgi:hypothetical protein
MNPISILTMLDDVLKAAAETAREQRPGTGIKVSGTKIPIRDSGDLTPMGPDVDGETMLIDGNARSLAQRASENV